jgi:hypothetical protein
LRNRARRVRLISVLAGLLVIVGAVPAFADPATPTNYRSEVDAVTPSGSFAAEIIGGDAFVRVVVGPGTDLVVLGYEGEPYIWFAPDGVVSVNRRSPAAYLNDDRYAQVTLPEEAAPSAEPRWERAASGGVYSWHDHRTHWMSRTPPAVVTETGRGEGVDIFEWSLPVLVGGSPGAIDGTLAWVPSTTPALWVLIAIGFAAVAFVALRGRPGRTPIVVTIMAVVALVPALGTFLAQPSDVRVSGVDLIAPIVALAIGGYALFRRRDGVITAARIAAVGAGALIVWAVLRIGVLTHPLLPTLLAPNVERLLTSAVLGVGVGVIAAFTASLATSAPGPSRATTP